MIIRKAGLEDKYQIGKIFSDENDYHFRLQPSFFNIIEERDIMPDGWLEELIDNNNKELFVADMDGELVGLALISIHLDAENPIIKKKKWIDVNEISVIKDHRGKGIGKSLMIHVENFAKVHCVDYIGLEVWVNNDDAVRFYERNGFERSRYYMCKNII